ncbi:hypothetical protein FRC10_004357 [Ceratobasidium sp. 414]|nr:hypothetical protein FRC10_004357 [Ceratobasidium sp. 414]
MPVVWEHVDGVVPIFKLVDGCEISYYQDRNDFEVTSVNLPNILSDGSFVRLRVYSSFVKSLDIFGKKAGIHYGMTNASTLLSYTDHHELLPNLRKLTTNEFSFMIAYFFWFRVFASRSLLEIRPIVLKYTDIPFVPVPVISAFVESVLQRCPLVHTLGLFARNGSLDELDHDLEHLAFTGNTGPLHQALVQVKTLVNVSGSAMLFDRDIFTALGKLPLLTRLEVRYERDDDDDESPLKPTHVEDGAFPSLRHVVLSNVTDSDIGFFWNMPTLAKRLTTVDITFHHDPADPRHHWVRRDFVTMMCHNSPKITDLRFDFLFDFIPEDENPPPMFKLTEEIFQAISGLFLTKLDLSRTRLGFADGIRRLATAWPEMEVLKWTAQHVTLEELCLFAEHMPRLRHLALEIKMVPLAQDLDLECVSTFRQPVLRILESGFHRLCEFTPKEGCRLYQ